MVHSGEDLLILLVPDAQSSKTKTVDDAVEDQTQKWCFTNLYCTVESKARCECEMEGFGAADLTNRPGTCPHSSHN